MESATEVSAENTLFNSYPEIENHYNKSIIEMINEYQTDELWVATEKIHGTNFSFICSDEGLQCARRTGILKDKDSFNNFQGTILKKHGDNIKELYKCLKEEGVIANLTSITIFGEFYGGIYPGMKSVGKKIQDFIYYSPSSEFEAFDLFYTTSDNAEKQIYPYKESCLFFERFKIPFAAVLHEGTVKELLAKLDPNTFQSTIYAKHGLPKLDDNIAEGYVIKPNVAMKDKWGNRMSIKVKSDRCLEGPKPPAATQKAAPAKKAPVELTPEQEEVLARALSYVNKNRMENLWSKLTDEEKIEKTVVSALMTDAQKDFNKAESKEVIAISNKIKPQLMPALKEECLKLFKEFSEK